ncbi:MAG: outer membrane beta-barrel protein [Bryobacteraceae bacterium]
MRQICIFAFAAVLAQAQAPWKAGPVQAKGVVDVYYSTGFRSHARNINLLHNFDDRINQPALNMAVLSLDYSAGWLGAHVDAGAGRAFAIMSAGESATPLMQVFTQAYATFKPASWKGAAIDAGRFVTFAGAEVIESAANFNYSRSLLFTWCVPYHLFGIQVKAPLGSQFRAGAQWAAGWNNVVSGATYKTAGVTGTWTGRRAAWTNTWYGGPDENKAGRAYRMLYDTVLTLDTDARTSAAINFDYLNDKSESTVGVAGAVRMRLSNKTSISSRCEILNDGAGATGAAQVLKEFTVTARYAFASRLLGFLEFRRDWSDRRFFDGRKSQPTLLMGLVAAIGRKR